MHIGLITFHETTNFGSFLQTYALYKAVMDLGYDCEVLDYKCDSIEKRELPRKTPVTEYTAARVHQNRAN